MISPATIQLVKDRTDLVSLVSESVPSLKRRGRSFVGLCPFHKEKSPSFHVSPERGFFHCFGCKESGSAVDFVMKTEGLTFPEAIRRLAERANVEVEETRSDEERSEAERQKRARDELYAACNVAGTYFERMLREHEHKDLALAELARRDLVPGASPKVDDVLQAFRVGYAPPGWDGLAQYLKSQGISPVAAETVGLLVPRSSGTGHYDRFRNRLMFAVLDPQGRTVAFSGRALPEPPGAPAPKADEKPAKYINSPESPVYTKGHLLFGLFQGRHAIRAKEEAVIVEGNFDVVSLHARGFDHAVAPLGTAFTLDQAKALRRFASRAVFLFDGDLAGRKASRASVDPARKADLDVRIAQLPPGQDPDDYVRQKGAAELGHVVEVAMGAAEALVEMELDASFSADNVREKLARVERVVRLVAEEQNPLVRLALKARADELAGRLDLHGLRPQRDDRAHSEPLRELERMLKAALPARESGGGPTPREARVAPRQAGSEERRAIVRTLIEWPVLLDDPEVSAELVHLEGPSVEIVAALGGARARETGQVDADGLLRAVDGPHRDFVARALAGEPEHDEAKKAKGYLLENANKLKRLLLSQEASARSHDLRRAEGVDWSDEVEAAREVQAALRARHGIRDR